ncbi:hypothetical protein [Caldivirga sp.]|uniref:hypothetical protein n=1 Tax=Caldivirga sp. TaxID=2080243 RepID=UPI003D10E2AE
MNKMGWEEIIDGTTRKVVRKLGIDRDTGLPSVGYIEVDKVTGLKEHEVYVWSNKFNDWVRVHWDLEDPYTGSREGFTFSKRSRQSLI